MAKEYEPYGKEWKKEVMKLKKSQIIDMMANIGKDRDKLREELSVFACRDEVIKAINEL